MKHLIGILALQGDFEKHREAIAALGFKSLLVKKAQQLDALDGLIIPGGESTTLLKLLDANFRQALIDKISKGLPCFATCAGLILLANEVTDPAQESLSLLNVSVSRNAYGRQKESFVTSELNWTDTGNAFLDKTSVFADSPQAANQGFFIRAPRINAVGNGVSVLVKYQEEPVCILQGTILAASFHPELSKSKSALHEIFTNLIQR